MISFQSLIDEMKKEDQEMVMVMDRIGVICDKIKNDLADRRVPPGEATLVEETKRKLRKQKKDAQ